MALFGLGCLLAYLTLEKALEFLISWAGQDVQATFQVSKYVSLVTLMAFAFGIGFLSMASSSAASAPNHGSMARGASMKPAQNRTGSASARSQDNQERRPGCPRRGPVRQQHALARSGRPHHDGQPPPGSRR